MADANVRTFEQRYRVLRCAVSPQDWRASTGTIDSQPRWREGRRIDCGADRYSVQAKGVSVSNKAIAIILFALAVIMLALGWSIRGLPPAVTGVGFAVIGYYILRAR